MAEILIHWLEFYTGVSPISTATKFSELNFDIFDEAQTVKFIRERLALDANTHEIWPSTIQDLLNSMTTNIRNIDDQRV